MVEWDEIENIKVHPLTQSLEGKTKSFHKDIVWYGRAHPDALERR